MVEWRDGIMAENRGLMRETKKRSADKSRDKISSPTKMPPPSSGLDSWTLRKNKKPQRGRKAQS